MPSAGAWAASHSSVARQSLRAAGKGVLRGEAVGGREDDAAEGGGEAAVGGLVLLRHAGDEATTVDVEEGGKETLRGAGFVEEDTDGRGSVEAGNEVFGLFYVAGREGGEHCRDDCRALLADTGEEIA